MPTEKELKQAAIDAAVKYYEVKHKPKKDFEPGDRISYGGRVFNEKEIINLVDSALDFWLTTGKYADQFEKEFAAFMGVKHCSLTNSGSSANLLAFMALTSHKLGDKRIKKGDEVITSGMDNIFFEGLKVGRVTEVTNLADMKIATVKSYVNVLKKKYFHA